MPLLHSKSREAKNELSYENHENTYYGPPKVTYFQRKAETASIDCWKLLHDDKLSNYTRQVAASRPKLPDRHLSTRCKEVRARVVPKSTLERLYFGVAYARIVYESYEFIEDELRSSYHPQNVFCYSIDSKAKKEFADRIGALAKCLPNVIVPTMSTFSSGILFYILASLERFDIGRKGINGTRAHYECMKSLMAYEGWGYVILMQNYDVMIKTVYETVNILRALGGANDVHVRPCESHRYNKSLKWDVRSLKFYRNEARMTSAQLNASLTFARGAAHASLSRAAADWMVNTIDLTKTFEQLDRNVLGVDEVLIPTLQVSDDLDMPGRFTAECVRKGHVIGFITRVESWQYDKSPECRSKHYRHAVCVYGIEDFVWLASHPKLMANKMMPSFDYGAVDCMHELIFNRTHVRTNDHIWNLKLYKNQPYVCIVYFAYLVNSRNAVPGVHLTLDGTHTQV
ncbi:Core-2/I-Branching enzyme [Ostertagia ostertagi]